MPDSAIHVTLTEPDVAGSYVVSEQHDDGSLLLRPVPEPAEDDPKAPYRAIVERHRETFDRLAQ